MKDVINGAKSDGTNDSAPLNQTAPIRPVFDFMDVFSQVMPDVVKIKIPGTTYFGTGFFVSVGETNSCDIATSNHVTNGRDEIKAVTLDGRSFAAKLQKVDLPHEISIYQLQDVPDPSKTCKPVQLGSVPSNNEILMGLGEIAGDTYNIGMRTVVPYLEQTLGWITRNEREFPPLDGEDMNRQMISMFPIGQHGFSGGPVFDYQSKVVGIGAGGSGTEMIMEPIKYLADDLAELNEKRKSNHP